MDLVDSGGDTRIVEVDGGDGVEVELLVDDAGHEHGETWEEGS